VLLFAKGHSAIVRAHPLSTIAVRLEMQTYFDFDYSRREGRFECALFEHSRHSVFEHSVRPERLDCLDWPDSPDDLDWVVQLDRFERFDLVEPVESAEPVYQG